MRHYSAVAFFLPTVFVIFFARQAYFSDMMVSSWLEDAGEQLTNISVFAVPPRASCMSIVSLWFRHAMKW